MSIIGSVLSPVSAPLVLLIVTIQKTFQVISFYHFWKTSETALSLSDKVKSTAADIVRIAAAPLFAIGLIFCCFYGVIAPWNAVDILPSLKGGDS